MNFTKVYVPILIFVLTSCHGSNSINSNSFSNSSTAASTVTSSSVSATTTENNLLYGSNERQVLDISYSNDLASPVAAVLFIHGGSWISGDKSNMLKYRSSVINEGYVYISMNYRLMTTQATYLDMLEDIDLAIQFIKNQTSRMPIDTSQIVLAGESAGAHLAMLYSYRNTSPIPIRFLLALVPPVDFTDPNYISFGNASTQLFLANQLMQTNIVDENELILNGYPESWLDASPIYYLDTAIPTLIGYGALDELIPQSNYLRFLDRVLEFNAPVEAIVFPNSGHSLDNDPVELALMFDTFFSRLETYLI